MFKKTQGLFEQIFVNFDAEMAEVTKEFDALAKGLDSKAAGDERVEEVREEETRPDGTRVVRIIKRITKR
jgi:hypothetical protein